MDQEPESAIKLEVNGKEVGRMYFVKKTQKSLDKTIHTSTLTPFRLNSNLPTFRKYTFPTIFRTHTLIF